MSKDLNPDKALIFRIVHRDNLAWILDHGLHCRNASVQDPHYVNIGNPELIERRTTREIDIAPYGTLSDYIPFYFTPYSPMLYNIKTGYSGVTARGNEEIVFLVSSLYRLREVGVKFLFTDRHAYLKTAVYADDLDQLKIVDWKLLQSRDFRRDPDDPDKFARYEAEALVHQHLPLDGLLGLACCNITTKMVIQDQLKARGRTLKLVVKRDWYF